MKTQSRRISRFRVASWFWLTTLLAFWLTGSAAAQTVIYVDIDATGANDGTSWQNAFVFLQDAIAVAQDGDEVWVAEGVYRPDQGAGVTLGDRHVSFEIDKAISLYGGFEGSESYRPSTDWQAHPTVLSGDLLANDTGPIDIEEPSRQDNSCHIVSIIEVAGDVYLEGVQLRDGNGFSGCSHLGFGGGIYLNKSVLHLRDVLVSANAASRGGGIYVDGGEALDFHGGLYGERIEIVNNSASWSWGGGLGSDRALVDIRNSLFKDNRSRPGEAVVVGQAVARFVNVTFIGNETVVAGGAKLTIIGGRFLGNSHTWYGAIVLVNDTKALIANSVFSGNRSTARAPILFDEGTDVEIINSSIANSLQLTGDPLPSIYCYTCTLRILNSILSSDDETVSPITVEGPDTTPILIGNSIVRGGLPARATDLGGNIDINPLFADPLGSDGINGTPDDDYRLLAGSPAVDHGDALVLPPDSLDIDGDGDLTEPLPIDLDGLPRRVGASVDMGAHEYRPTAHRVEADVPGTSLLEVGEPYPNPFDGSTTITVSSRVAGRVTVRVFDLLGRVVETVFDGPMIGGRVESIRLDGAKWSPGIYLVSVYGPTDRVERTAIRLRPY